MDGNPVLLADPRGNSTNDWVRLRQSDGTFKFEWNDKVKSQKDVDKLYKNKDATHLGKSFVARGLSIENHSKYYLNDNGKATDSEGNTVDASKIVGASHTPAIFLGGFGLLDSKCNCPLLTEARFRIFNLTEDEMKNIRIIQTMQGIEIPHRPNFGRDENGNISFVDGGVNSESARIEPWYAAPNNFKNMDINDKNPNAISFTLRDNPAAILTFNGVTNYTRLDFESYIVINNYNQNQNKFKIIGRVDWGVKNTYGGIISNTIANPLMQAASSFSKNAQKIWNKDYGKSEWKQY